MSSSVVYGANASGKTNIIGAMQTLRNIVLKGDIQDTASPNAATGMLSLIPNVSSKCEPVCFSIKFMEQGLLFQYSLEIYAGEFMDEEATRKILREELKINEELVFLRDKDKELYVNKEELKRLKKYLIEDFEKNNQNVQNIAKNSLTDEELFLKNGFKTMYSPKLTEIISSWMQKKFVIVYHANYFERTPIYMNTKKQIISQEEKLILDGIAEQLGIKGNTFSYQTAEDGQMRLYSVFMGKDGMVLKGLPAELYESYGTIRIINLLPLILMVLYNGGVLAADELDASIHPMILMDIINIFHDDKLNVRHAQLLFNTHNPIFLNSNIFRRDEIKFVERNGEKNGSEIYSLSDFEETKGRRNREYMENYFVNRYGAISRVEFAPIVRAVLKLDAEDANNE